MRMMRFARHRLALAPACLALIAMPAVADHSVEHVSERDYFAELPVVLSVSRLAQPLNEFPGAVTIIDARLIRRSGAREVAELLRLVPGFLVTRRNGGNTLPATTRRSTSMAHACRST
jgi:iron complex outermembrane receptor protein